MGAAGRLLIKPKWNVNNDNNGMIDETDSLLIEPEWNIAYLKDP